MTLQHILQGRRVVEVAPGLAGQHCRHAASVAHDTVSKTVSARTLP